MNAFDIIQQFFYDLSFQEAILLGILGLLVFILGIVIGWVVQSSSTKRYRKQLQAMTQERDEYVARYEEEQRKQKATATELERISREKVAAIDQNAQLREQLDSRSAVAERQQQRIHELTDANQNYALVANEMDEQVTELQLLNSQLREELENRSAGQTDNSGAGAGANGSDNSGGATRPTPPPGPTTDGMHLYLEAIEARFQAFERRLNEIDYRTGSGSGSSPQSPTPPSAPRDRAPNNEGGGNLTRTDYQTTLGEPFNSSDESQPTEAPTGEPIVIRADTTDPGVRRGHAGKAEVIVDTKPSLMVVDIKELPEDRDDLSRIQTIGPFLEKQLNRHGVYYFDQIAEWTEEDVDQMASQIGYMASIMHEQNWIGQANTLRADKQADPQKYARPTHAPDNLQVVEGIGPKIELVLRDAGVTTLSELADAHPDDLRGILAQAEGNFNGNDPSTWPEQAGLARDGKLDDLKVLQDRLKGGRPD